MGKLRTYLWNQLRNRVALIFLLLMFVQLLLLLLPQPLLLLPLCCYCLCSHTQVDSYFGLQNSATFGLDIGVDVIPCLRPNSLLWSNRLQGFLRGQEHLLLHGIEPGRYFPNLQDAGFSDHFCKGLAGNSFCAGQYLANFMGAIAVGGAHCRNT